ncbi:hypothetical protein PoB_003987600 [Plakobranchus ocellatus]|uniref:Uncharacterized protein n=1 Tax=Plakobranchus ocellatus TaxID=259542 RepID=A0AAV4AYN3_9GAST|nr:hypothetical protein PoB_003987600 [Plakobranchus ocellatus]
MLTLHHWASLQDEDQRPGRMSSTMNERLSVQDQGEPPSRRNSSVVWHGKGWAPPCDMRMKTTQRTIPDRSSPGPRTAPSVDVLQSLIKNAIFLDPHYKIYTLLKQKNDQDILLNNRSFAG